MNRVELGHNVKEYRREMGLTQAQFAELARISVRLVGMIEHFQVNSRMETVERVLDVLKVRPEKGYLAHDGRVIWFTRGHDAPIPCFLKVLKMATGQEGFYWVKHCYLRMMPMDQGYRVEWKAKRGNWPAIVLRTNERI